MAPLSTHLGTHLGRHLRHGVRITVVSMVAAALTLGVDAQAVTAADAVTDPASVEFFTPNPGRADQTVETVPVHGEDSYHLVMGAAAGVTSVQLSYSKDGVGPIPIATVVADPDSHVAVYDWPATVTGTVELQAAGLDATDAVVGTPATTTVALSRSRSHFSFVRPAPSGDALGVFRRADGHSFARASGLTTRAEEPTVDAPAFGEVAPPASALPAPTGSFRSEAKGWTYREPVDLTGNPGLALDRAVIRVSDSTSSAATVTPLYTQAIGAVTSTATPLPGSGNITITAKVTDQYGQVVVGAPVRLRGYANGSLSAVSQIAVSDAHDGRVTFTNGGAGFPVGFYVAYVDVNLNGTQGGRQELGSQTVLGTVSRAAPGKALYHDNARIRGAGGTRGDSLRGTQAAAARGYQWIDQNGQLSFSSRAVLRAGARNVSQPADLTWVNAHGAPFNPGWLKKGRFETRAWSRIKQRPGLRDADRTFQQNAAHGLSVEWEVKDIKPFTSAAALNAAFANLAASAQRSYGSQWRSRVQVKMLSNLSGGLPFALRVLSRAHAYGFTTILLARGAATRTQIPAAAHPYVTYVRGARAGLYAAP